MILVVNILESGQILVCLLCLRFYHFVKLPVEFSGLLHAGSAVVHPASMVAVRHLYLLNSARRWRPLRILLNGRELTLELEVDALLSALVLIHIDGGVFLKLFCI